MFRNRVRTYALIGAVAVAGVLAAVLPALGDHDTALDFIEFDATSSPPRFVLDSDPTRVQPIGTKKNSCEIVSNNSLLVLGAGGDAPGFASDSIGVRVNGPGANGTPCSQVQGAEVLKLTAAADVGSFAGVELDLEMTGDAVVKLTFIDGQTVATYELHTGNAYHALCATTQPDPDPDDGVDPEPWPGCEPDTDASAPSVVDTPTGILDSACASPNSSGPNSGANDNCIWGVNPGFEFTAIHIAVANGVGTVSLEGGSDYEDPDLYSSKFFIAENAAPIANDQSVFFDYSEDPEGEPVEVVFDLDVTDPNGDPLTFTGVPDGLVAGVGTFSRSGTTVTFTPILDFTGSYAFTYTAADDGDPALSDDATVTIYEVLDCGETLSVTDGTITAEYERLFPEEGGCDVAKPYDVEIVPVEGEDSVVRFQPKPREGDPVPDCSIAPDEDSETPDAGDCTDEFLGILSFGTESETNAPTTGTLEYDPVVRDEPDPSAFRAMKWCEFDPTDPPSGVARRNALPSGESWCIIEVNVSIANSAKTITNWYVYGIGDPFKRLS